MFLQGQWEKQAWRFWPGLNHEPYKSKMQLCLRYGALCQVWREVSNSDPASGFTKRWLHFGVCSQQRVQHLHKTLSEIFTICFLPHREGLLRGIFKAPKKVLALNDFLWETDTPLNTVESWRQTLSNFIFFFRKLVTE